MRSLLILLMLIFIPVFPVMAEEESLLEKRNGSKSIDELQIQGLGLATIGMRVSHALFGNGVIIDIAEFPDGSHTINVEFEDIGSKWLVPKYAKLVSAE